ncbi:MAG: hypothetical protein K8I30_06580 [Anaerolineae bacterium]|nr:hypothetical protein [Anaerolineae bacterium]
MGFFIFLFLAIVAVMVLGSVLKVGLGLLVAIVLWMLAGMFAGRFLRGRGYGPVMDVLLGLVGGFVGSFVLRLIGLGWIGDVVLVGNVLVGMIGAIIFVYIIRVIGDQSFAR